MMTDSDANLVALANHGMLEVSHQEFNQLLAAAGLNQSRRTYKLEVIRGGRNNRAYRLLIGDERFFLKHYFKSNSDSRDRLKQEYEFLKYLSRQSIVSVARPIACNKTAGLALYQYLDGRNVISSMLVTDYIDQAAQFILAINANRLNGHAKILANASEAGFHFSSHLMGVEKRLEKLSQISENTITHQQAKKFVTQVVLPAWEKERAKLSNWISINEESFERNSIIILSPSDFGFHNIIVNSNDQLYFYDFEYAGWDSLVKLLCDFKCQPQVEIKEKYFKCFLEQLSIRWFDFHDMNTIINKLTPLYRIKWCCILLNDFIYDSQRRRRFALNNTRPFNLDEQLKSAKQYLNLL